MFSFGQSLQLPLAQFVRFWANFITENAQIFKTQFGHLVTLVTGPNHKLDFVAFTYLGTYLLYFYVRFIVLGQELTHLLDTLPWQRTNNYRQASLRPT